MSTSATLDKALSTIGSTSLATAINSGTSALSIPIPFQNKIVLFEDARIAGTSNFHGAKSLAISLELNSELKLEREQGNLADRWAIKVLAEGKVIGFVSADCNEILARLMDGGKALSARLVSKNVEKNLVKLRMEVSLDD